MAASQTARDRRRRARDLRNRWVKRISDAVVDKGFIKAQARQIGRELRAALLGDGFWKDHVSSTIPFLTRTVFYVLVLDQRVRFCFGVLGIVCSFLSILAVIKFGFFTDTAIALLFPDVSVSTIQHRRADLLSALLAYPLYCVFEFRARGFGLYIMFAVIVLSSYLGIRNGLYDVHMLTDTYVICLMIINFMVLVLIFTRNSLLEKPQHLLDHMVDISTALA